MSFSVIARLGTRGAAVAALGLLAAACQSAQPQAAQSAQQSGPVAEVNVDELRAFCPRVALRADTTIRNDYERGGEDDPQRLVRQSSIVEVTRNCTYGADTLTVNVAAAGRVVTGPRGSAGNVTLPIRVTAMRGAETLYSQVQQLQVAVADTAGATQFVFTDPNVVLPQAGIQGVRVFIGFDE